MNVSQIILKLQTYLCLFTKTVIFLKKNILQQFADYSKIKLFTRVKHRNYQQAEKFLEIESGCCQGLERVKQRFIADLLGGGNEEVRK